MWRPGKLRFLISVKNPLPIDRPRPPENTAPCGTPPVARFALRSGYALPSSRIRRYFLTLIDVLFSSCSPRSRRFSCSICSTFMAKPSTRCRFGIGRSVFATRFRARARRCTSATTRSAADRSFYDRAYAPKVEGIVSKRVDAPYVPSNRGLWLKVKCLNREEFVVVGWTA